jgi:predicted nucleotidyltransferase
MLRGPRSPPARTPARVRRMTADLVERLRARLAREPEPLVAAYLYGSVARGEAHARSDVDLALLYRMPPARVLASPPRLLEDELERELGRPVEVVVLGEAPPDLVRRVLRDGILLLDRDRAARLRFEVQAWNEYFDLQPILDLYRRKGTAG